MAYEVIATGHKPPFAVEDGKLTYHADIRLPDGHTRDNVKVILPAVDLQHLVRLVHECEEAVEAGDVADRVISTWLQCDEDTDDPAPPPHERLDAALAEGRLDAHTIRRMMVDAIILAAQH